MLEISCLDRQTASKQQSVRLTLDKAQQSCHAQDISNAACIDTPAHPGDRIALQKLKCRPEVLCPLPAAVRWCQPCRAAGLAPAAGKRVPLPEPVLVLQPSPRQQR